MGPNICKSSTSTHSFRVLNMCIKISHPWKHPLTSIKISHFGEVLPRLCIESLGRSIATSSSSAKSCELSCELSSGLRQVREDPWQLVKVYPQRASYFGGKTDDQPWDFGGWVPHFQTNPCVIQFGRSLHQPSFRVVSNIHHSRKMAWWKVPLEM